MSFDLDTINQAWYIACEEAMENVTDDKMTNETMLTYIADYCRMHSNELIKQAAKELKENGAKR
jgi:3-deoxy-D-arabino-heptulosonate 7-phosphate (DAHP) synthase